MICPVCRNPMIVVEYRQIELDYCTNCFGVWFDGGELKLMLERLNIVETRLPDTISETKTAEKKRKCPICGRRMKKRLIGRKPEILIDACPEKEGLWFDGDEIDALLAQLAPKEAKESAEEQIISFLKDVFQAKK